jgi:hypothetical protein
MTRLSSSEARMLGRIGGLTTAATSDMRARGARGQAAFNARFEDEVDPDRKLSPAERARRADLARRRYFARIALKSARTRSARSARHESSAAVSPAAPEKETSPSATEEGSCPRF